MIDDGHFYVMEQDGGATSSGYGELQDRTAFTAPPSGNYVFKSHKVITTAVNPSARVASITIAAGAISGTADLLDLGITSNSVAVSGSLAMTTPHTNGEPSFTFNDD